MLLFILEVKGLRYCLFFSSFFLISSSPDALKPLKIKHFQQSAYVVNMTHLTVFWAKF